MQSTVNIFVALGKLLHFAQTPSQSAIYNFANFITTKTDNSNAPKGEN